ncbi:acetylornithine aminotransferase [Psychrobacter sp. JCM 18902]|nr:acetylornithine aminotransferase [Psychrobacter sp. JCM 18902]
MEKLQSWDTITQTGLNIKNSWQKLADKYELEISQFGLPALTGFSFTSEKNLYYKTLVTQEMLKKGYLASNVVYVCTEHTKPIVEGYMEALDPIFSLIKECEQGRSVEGLLDGPVCHSGFKRLN